MWLQAIYKVKFMVTYQKKYSYTGGVQLNQKVFFIKCVVMSHSLHHVLC